MNPKSMKIRIKLHPSDSEMVDLMEERSSSVFASVHSDLFYDVSGSYWAEEVKPRLDEGEVVTLTREISETSETGTGGTSR